MPSVTGQLCMCCIWHVWLVGIGGIRWGWSGVHVLLLGLDGFGLL